MEKEKLKKRLERVWLEFEEDGSIQTYLRFQRLVEQVEPLKTESKPVNGQKD